MPCAPSKKRSRPRSSVKDTLDDVRKLLKEYDQLFLTHILEAKRTFQAIEAHLVKQTEQLEMVRLTGETAEETFLNVLLAIRQCDALKAWFPAQKGFSEGHVAGPHPTWIGARANNAEDPLIQANDG